MDTSFIKGIIPPVVTPFTKDEKFDEAAFRKHIDWMIKGGIAGLLVFGSNGEFYMLEEDEMEEIITVAVDQVKGRIPVYMGIGAIRTSKCVRLAKMGASKHVDGISILQPMFIKPTEAELKLHFETIARAAIATGADGLFIETHQNPAVAKSDGANMLPLHLLEGLLKRLTILRKAVV